MPPTGPRTTMRQHADVYLSRIRGQIEPSTYESQRSVLLRFATWWDSTRKVPKSLREADVEAYLFGPHTCIPGRGGCRERIHRGAGLRETNTDRTVNKCLGTLKGFLTWAFRNGLVRGEVIQPTESRVRVHASRRLRIDIKQIGEMVSGAEDPYERMVCALAVYTGGRGGELTTIRIGDVDLDAGEIDWTRHKTRQDDVLPIMDELAAELKRWFEIYERKAGRLQPSWFLIPSRHCAGVPGIITYRPTQQRGRGCHFVVKKHLARVLGVDESTLRGEGVHTARRSIARALYEQLCEERNPDPIVVVQALLGHSSRVMTERYIGVESGRAARDKALRGRSMLRRE